MSVDPAALIGLLSRYGRAVSGRDEDEPLHPLSTREGKLLLFSILLLFITLWFQF